MVERFGATAIDYRAGDFVAAVRELTRPQGSWLRCRLRCDWRRAFRAVFGGLLVGYGAQTMAVGNAGLASAALGWRGSLKSLQSILFCLNVLSLLFFSLASCAWFMRLAILGPHVIMVLSSTDVDRHLSAQPVGT